MLSYVIQQFKGNVMSTKNSSVRHWCCRQCGSWNKKLQKGKEKLRENSESCLMLESYWYSAGILFFFGENKKKIRKKKIQVIVMGERRSLEIVCIVFCVDWHWRQRAHKAQQLLGAGGNKTGPVPLPGAPHSCRAPSPMPEGLSHGMKGEGWADSCDPSWHLCQHPDLCRGWSWAAVSRIAM